MLGAYGLKTHIWNNRLKSFLLLAGFPFLMLLICFAFALLISAMENPDVGEGIVMAWELLPSLIPVALIASGVWFAIAWFANQKIVDLATGATPLDRKTDPRTYNLLENLCISRGIPMPRLHVIETPVLNAYASGIRRNQYTVTVTRGLMDALNDQELEAVLGHELTHIRNKDVQLLVIAAVFVGIISLVGDLLIRVPRMLFYTSGRSSSSRSSSSSSGSSRGGKGGGGGAIILILIAVAIFVLARILAIGLRMAMSRKREFMADAGAVELTRNPDAMISALRKISGRSDLPAPSQIRQMFIDYPDSSAFFGMFATHPPIDKRVEALVRYAGGRDVPPPPPPPAPELSPDNAAPWGPAASGDGAPETTVTPPDPWGSAR